MNIVTTPFQQLSNDDDFDGVTLSDDDYNLIHTLDNKLNEDKYEWLNYLYDIGEEYIRENVLSMSSEKFHDMMWNELDSMFYLAIENMYSIPEDLYIYLCIPKILLERAFRLIYSKVVPMRSYYFTYIREHIHKDPQLMQAKINQCQSRIQPDQRSDEWYQFRHKIITASNAWKAFDSPSLVNSLIYEKCAPYVKHSSPTNGYINTESPLHWGQKYEPLSIMIYEHQYSTSIGEFGCLPHDKYPFLGASPDGINISVNNPRFGRMLEIKNIVNREITKIPKKEYWIQMQLQMEVCDLNECDFLETRFVEYATEDEYYEDGDEFVTSDGKKKGKLLLFYENNAPLYEYYVPSIHGEYTSWEEDKFLKHENKMFMRTIYWKMDEFSCILVLRNKLWFQEAVIKLKEVSDIIQHEKTHGYEHRAPKKRVRKSSFDISENKCLISITSKVKENIENDLSESVVDENKSID